MQVTVKDIKGKATYKLEVAEEDTVGAIKAQLVQEGVDVRCYSLAFKGKKLEEEAATLAALAVKNKSVLLLMRLPKNLRPKEVVKEEEEAKAAEKAKEEPAAPPSLCLANCGFYGTESRKGYCSKCYTDLGLDKDEKAAEKAAADTAAALEGKAEDEDTEMEEPIEQKDFKRCWKCQRDVGLLGFKCQCQYVFCAKHRYGDKHDCTVDYKARQQVKLNKDLEKVVGGKVDRIG